MFNFKCKIMEITREQYHKLLIGTVPKKYHNKMLEEFDNLKKHRSKQSHYGHKRMNDINTFQAHENEMCLRGTDEYGNTFTVWWDSYDFINWINKEQLDYIKKQLTKYIQEK